MSRKETQQKQCSEERERERKTEREREIKRESVPGHCVKQESTYWKWNFPMSPHVRLSVGWLVGRFVLERLLSFLPS